MLLDVGGLDRRRQQNAALGRGSGQFGDGNIGRARQRGGSVHGRAAPIGEHEAAIAAIARHPVGKCEGQHEAGGRMLPSPWRGGRRARPLTGRHLRRPALRQTARTAGAWRAVAAELIEPDIKIDAVAAEPALGEDSGDFRGLLARAPTMRIHDHARQPRRQRQRAQAVAFRRDPAIAVERTEFAQQASRLLQRRRRRRIQKRQGRGIADAPLREVEHQRRQVGAENFRLGIGRQRRGLRLVPQPVTHAGLGAAGTASALIDRGARRAHGFQPRQADVRLIPRHPRHAGIDDNANALDGQRGFRDRGRQHHLALALRRRRNGAILHGRVQRTEQRHDFDAGIVDPFAEKILGAADLGRPRQKRQHRARIGVQRHRNRIRHLPLQRRIGLAAEIAGLDRKGAAFA